MFQTAEDKQIIRKYFSYNHTQSVLTSNLQPRIATIVWFLVSFDKWFWNVQIWDDLGFFKCCKKTVLLGLILICGQWTKFGLQCLVKNLFVIPTKLGMTEQSWQAVFTGCGCIYRVYNHYHILKENHCFSHFGVHSNPQEKSQFASFILCIYLLLEWE